MTLSSIIGLALGLSLVCAYALWRLGVDCGLASFGRLIIRVVTFGKVRLTTDGSENAAMGVAAVTLIAIYICFLIIEARVQ